MGLKGLERAEPMGKMGRFAWIHLPQGCRKLLEVPLELFEGRGGRPSLEVTFILGRLTGFRDHFQPL